MNPDWQSSAIKTHDRRWNECISHSEEQDIFYYSEYMNLFERINDNKGVLFTYGNREEFIAYPFFLQDISKLPFYDRQDFNNTSLYDIVSPWYYGGYLYRHNETTDKERLFKAFYQEFSAFCKENKIISEFGRYHPFIDNEKFFEPSIKTRTVGSIVYIDLNQDKDTIWENITKSNQKKIKKGIKNNINVSFSKSADDIRVFSDLYARLMQEKGAIEFYKFSDDFFNTLSLNLNDRMELLLASYNDKVIAGLLLLGKNRCIHTFLSASNPDYRDLGPNNLLKYIGALRGKDLGFQYYLLGGGYGETGSLLEYKKSFSKTIKDFKVYYKIWDEGLYEKLSIKNDEYKRKMAISNKKDDFYFPEYRR
jgi:hypothetical protein